MNNREYSDKIQMEMNPNHYDHINYNPDNRVKMIYNRYRMGKTIIMDDLKYLWSKDPEGCDKLAKSIVESNTVKVLEVTTNNSINNEDGNMSTDNTKEEQSNYIEDRTDTGTLLQTVKFMPEIIGSVKLMIEKMSENERKDISKNLYDWIELKKLTHKMKYWDDTFLDKMTMYTYDGKNDYDILA